MSAEGKPHDGNSLFARLLAGLTQLALLSPATTLVLAVLVAGAAIGLAVWKMEFRTSRLDLLDRQSDFNQLWLAYLDEFAAQDDTVVVVEGPRRDVLPPVLDEIAAALAARGDLFANVLHKVDRARLRAKGLHYLSVEELGQVEQFVAGLQPVAAGQWEHLNLQRYLGSLTAQLQMTAAPQAAAQRALLETHLTSLARSLSQQLDAEEEYRSPWPAFTGSAGATSGDSEYFFARGHDGTEFGFVLVHIADQGANFTRGDRAIGELRQLVASLAKRHPGVKLGVTGLPVMEFDEMQTSQQDMTLASLISLGAVVVIFVAGLGGWRHAFLCIAALLLALGWSFGYITLSVGHLNILSVSFAVMLIGMGIDFGIHFVAQYLHLRQEGEEVDEALTGATEVVGPGIITGAVTTALAFFTTTLTDFTGIAELGVISGGGVLLCVVAALVVLPALIALSDRGTTREAAPETLSTERWFSAAWQQPLLVLAAGVLATAFLGWQALGVRYDHNLLNLQPEGIESVALEERLLGETDLSVWFALSIADSREELLARKARFDQLPTVAKTEEIVTALPAPDERRGPLIARIGARLGQLPARPQQIPVSQPAAVADQLAQAQALIAGADERSHDARKALSDLRRRLVALAPAQGLAALDRYQTALAADVLARLTALRAASDPTPPTWDDLPAALVQRFLGKSQRHLLRVFSRGSVWDHDALGAFVADVKRVDPQATGQPLQAYFASRQMQNSYLQAALYAFLAVFVAALLDFGSTRSTLWALAPMLLALAQTFGLMAWLGLPLNPANMLVLPLVIGAGIDYGVHVIHDYHRQRGPFRLSSATATAVVLSSLTTIVGFGSLLFASHRGLQSLGRVLVIGITFCLLNALLLLPAYLAWRTRQRQEQEEDEADGASAALAPIPEVAPRAPRPVIADEPTRRVDPPQRPARAEESPAPPGLRRRRRVRLQ